MTVTIAPPPAPVEDPTEQRPPLRDPEDVVAWLRSLDPTTCAGHAHHPAACPLALYLRARHMRDQGSPVYIYAASYEVSGRSYRMPLWAESFVRRIDDLPRRPGRFKSCEVTAQEALEVLGRAQAHALGVEEQP